MENINKKNEWKVRFEVTFYGNDTTRGSFREIREDTIVINEEFQINNKVNFILLNIDGGVKCSGPQVK